MFGLYRTLLAVLVVIHHLYLVPLIGKFAVHGFFILSGFLMTYGMHNRYGYSAAGRIRFIKARALRLYPAYWVAAAFSLSVIVAMGAQATAFRSTLYVPTTPVEIFENLTFLYLDWYPNRVQPRLSPATWALTIELFYYALICIGISSNRALTWVWFAVSAFYHFAVTGLDNTYYHILSGSLPFSMGALIYHYREKVRFGVSMPWVWGVGGAVAILPLAVIGSFYLNMVVAAGFIIVLMNAGQDRGDTRLGDFSYHIYILHWPVAVLVYTALGYDSPNKEWMPLVLTIAGCLAISAALTRWVDNPAARLRGRKPLPAP